MPEELIINQCAPTLAGIKTGNLFTCEYSNEKEMYEDLRRINCQLVPKGIRVLPLRYRDNKGLIYFYRPERLKADMSDSKVIELLNHFGYACSCPDRDVVQLACRFKEENDFPHEIGLFLGYPPEDVQGFIENRAQNCKCIGYWKVYGDERQAKEKFELYRKYTAMYYELWEQGRTINDLATVPGH